MSTLDWQIQAVRRPDGPPDAVLPDLIGAQARARPAATAVRQWGERISYGELWSMAGRLAAALRAAGAGPETLVCVCVRRRPAALAALIGVQLAGAAYVPLDPDDPPARHAGIAADAGGSLAVADDRSAAAMAALGLTVLRIPRDGPVISACPARPDNAAYVLYTSGSTGVPKGVVVTHRSLTSYVSAFSAFTGAGPGVRSFGFASLAFDVSVADLFVPLATGGEVDLLSEQDRADPARLQRFCEEHSITWGNVPVAVLSMLDPARLPCWRTLITGAEAPAPEQVVRWTGQEGTLGRRFINCYGTTETTVDLTAFEATGSWDRPLPIGVPFGDDQVYLVDERLGEVTDGTPGELLVGGTSLARGYLRRPGLTAQRFVPDPFGAVPGARLYRTGDLAVRRDGVLEFIGRRDSQVKIRGRRVELGEIEAVLGALPQVRHAVVDAVPDGAGSGSTSRRLVAYCLLAEGADEASVLAACGQRLPAVFVPSAVIALDAFPLTTSGKVDLGALRALSERRPASTAAWHPAGPVTKAVAAIWHEVLGQPAVSADDDFFGAGGHSIAAMRLVAELRSELGKAVSIEDVFDGRTLAEIAGRTAAAPPLDNIDLVTGNPPALSPAQRRLWFLDQLAPQSAAYNIAVAERIAGSLDVRALELALAGVARRHEVLRWRIGEAAGEPVVEVREPEFVSLPVQAATEPDLAGLLDAEAARPFSLADGALWRARLFRLGPQDHVLALAFHHVVFDGWSQRPYYADLGAAYRAVSSGGDAALAALPAGFGDYVAWRAARERARGAGDLQWWREHLTGAPVTVDLPRDAARPAVQTYQGAMVSLAQPAEVSAAVAALSRRLGVSVSAVMLAGFCVLLHRLTGQADLVIGTPAADRRHPDFGGLVGFFVEILPLRIRVDETGDFASLALACSDELIAALAHPAASLEQIVAALGVSRDAGRQPLVQVLFNVYNFPQPSLELDGLTARPVDPAPGGSPFDLTVYAAERDGTDVVDVLYNTDLYSHRRAQAISACYLDFVGALATSPDKTLSAVPPPAAWAAASGGAVASEPRPHEQEQRAIATGEPIARPASLAEEQIASIWREVLGLPEVSVTENFFDAGGSSLALITVRSLLADRLGRELSVADLFLYPTVRALAGHVQGTSGAPELARAAARAAARRQRARRGRPDDGGSR